MGDWSEWADAPRQPVDLIQGASGQIPPGYVRYPGEVIKSISFDPRPPRRDLPSTESLLTVLYGVDNPADLGKNGMPIASRAFGPIVRGEGRYQARFVRDALVSGLFEADYRPRALEASVLEIATYQGRKNVPGSDTENFGEFPHEIRNEGDPIRALLTAQHNWEWPYFGSTDATPLWINATMRAAANRPDVLLETVRQSDGGERALAEVLDDAVDWLWLKMGENPQQLIESDLSSNRCWQVWMDSQEIYHHGDDGRLARGRVAAIEVQAYAYDALLQLADLVAAQPALRNAGLRQDEQRLRDSATALRKSVLEHFWIADQHGYFMAAGTERFEDQLNALAIRTVNMGLILDSGLLEKDANESLVFDQYVEGIVEQMFHPVAGLWSKHGLRGLGPTSPRYRNHCYHAQIWPWAMYVTANGLERHGFNELAALVRHTADDRVDYFGSPLECFPVSDGPLPHMNQFTVHALTPDGNGSMFANAPMEPGQLIQLWTAEGRAQSQRRRQPGTTKPARNPQRSRAIEQTIIDRVGPATSVARPS